LERKGCNSFWQAELLAGDLVLAFGSLHEGSGSFSSMKDIVANSENRYADWS